MNMKPEAMVRWTLDNAADLYGVRNWGQGFFDISERGELEVRRTGTAQSRRSASWTCFRASSRGQNLPVLLRFADILASRIDHMYEVFNTAIRELGYQGVYRGVYPIKVNQQKQVVAEIMEFGRKHHHGLEAGSKAELMAAIAYVDDPESLLVCNGYKDEEFIDLALYARKIGIQTVLVIEMSNELPIILARAARMGVRPCLGVRVKLSSRAGGHWDGSGGDRSMFGVHPQQVIDIIDRLAAENMLDCLQMLHYHLGSQVANIRNIRGALREACRYYVAMAREGAAWARSTSAAALPWTMTAPTPISPAAGTTRTRNMRPTSLRKS